MSEERLEYDGVRVQTTEHPGCICDAKFWENGDIARIWTIYFDNVSDAAELDSFATRLSQYMISRKRVGGLKLEDFLK